MAHSKETEHYKLPIITQDDHPDFLTDYNDAMYTLDNAIYLNEYSHEELQKLVEGLSLNMDNITTEFEDIKAKVEALVNLEDNQVFIELKEQVEGLNTSVIELRDQVNGHDTKITDIENSINTINTDLNALHDSFDKLEAEVTHNTEDITSLNESFVDINKNMGYMQADINELKTDVSAMKITVSRHDSDIAELKRDQESDNERLIDLELNVGRNTNDIAKITQAIYVVNKELSDRIDSVVQTAAGSTVELKELTDKVDGLSTVVDQNRTDIDTLEEKVTELETTGPDLSAIQSEIDAIKTEQDVQDDLITRNTDDIAMALTTMAGLKTQIDEVERKAEEIETLKISVDEVESSVSTLTTDVEGLRNYVATAAGIPATMYGTLVECVKGMKLPYITLFPSGTDLIKYYREGSTASANSCHGYAIMYNNQVFFGLNDIHIVSGSSGASVIFDIRLSDFGYTFSTEHALGQWYRQTVGVRSGAPYAYFECTGNISRNLIVVTIHIIQDFTNTTIALNRGLPCIFSNITPNEISRSIPMSDEDMSGILVFGNGGENEYNE